MHRFYNKKIRRIPMVRKTSLLLIFALTITMLFGSLSVAADGSEEPSQVATPPVTDTSDTVQFAGTVTSIILGAEPDTGTITVEANEDAASLTPVTPITWTVHINADTRICIGPEHEEGTIADLAIGQRVKGEGVLQEDGSVLAHKIHVRLVDDAQVGFRGTIEAKFDDGTLTVQMGSRTLTVVTDENTEIKDADGNPITFDDLEVGQQIKGKGILQEDGTILASEIQVLDDHKWVRFEGVITDLPDDGLIGEWTVATTNSRAVTFSVDENTRITPPHFRPAVGDWAKVTAVRREDGSLLALKVHLRKPEDHPRPVEFHGTIVEMEGDPPRKIVVNVWATTDAEAALVDVLIDDFTRIVGELRVGAHVKVQGFLLDNRTVLARLIVVKHPNEEVEFRGRIESIEDEVWIVGGVTVLITESTIITGATPQVGLLAEVKGIRVGPRTVRATQIEVKDPGLEPVAIRGIIAALPGTADHIGTWTITTEDGNDVTFEVTADTVIDTQNGEVGIGALVRVTALRQDDGTLVAQRIKVFESD
jgi:hypothetical protein